jgi:uncharacterized protein YkwD
MQLPRRPSRWAYTLAASTAVIAGLALSPVTSSILSASVAVAEPVGAVVESAPAAAPLDVLTAEQQLLALTNADREQNGLSPLTLDPDTLGVARERAETQLAAPSLTHYDSNGQLAFVQLLEHAGVDYSLAGENLARSSGLDTGLPQRVEDALMHSPTHRKNILEVTFTRVSIGAAEDDQGRISFAEIFRAE